MKTNDCIKWCLDRQLFDSEVTGLHVRWVASKSPLAVIVGENATGKSLFRRAVGAYCRNKADKRDIELIGLSMEGRAGGFMGAMRGFVYGDEHTSSTGANSAMTVSTAIRTAQGRETPHMVFWDEPDTGLSDRYAAGVGKAIADFVSALPTKTEAVFVVTHRKVLLQQLVEVDPHVLLFGKNAPASLMEYLTAPVLPAPLEQLSKDSHELFLKVNKVLKD